MPKVRHRSRGSVGAFAERRAVRDIALQGVSRCESRLHRTGVLMAIAGLISLFFAAIMLYRRRDIERMFAYSSIEHMGIIAFAFGIGGPLGNVAALLQMMMHSLTKSAIFFPVGHVARKGTQRIGGDRRTDLESPFARLGLVAGVAAFSGLPPFGIFTSEFL